MRRDEHSGLDYEIKVKCYDTDSLESLFDNIIFERSGRVTPEEYNSPEYHEYHEKSERLFQQIRDLLPDKHRQLLTEYDEIETARYAARDKGMFLRGAKDGIKLYRMLTGEIEW